MGRDAVTDARALMGALAGGKAIMMRDAVESVCRSLLASRIDTGIPEPADGREPITLSTAFAWTCHACGARHFLDPVPIEDPAECDRMNAEARAAGAIPEGGEAEWVRAPVQVACEPGCGARYSTAE